eukprot:CAMPEP_0119259578 /NCGR_PEP_ID=MMETSP1329-20130426/344_1 /TAXON_ID=114041 /ORGANISM="Genus nov. species nov., Strain RCC1024" /LENGTH=273 /DNA_ID=CAMNT_0007258967 /DNA_START=87 /DNA_END=905 /DNA_ORIENTATION=+
MALKALLLLPLASALLAPTPLKHATRLQAETDPGVASVIAALSSEQASSSARASVARSSSAKFEEAARLRTEALAALEKAEAMVKLALAQEADATATRRKELEDARAAYDACAAAKRERAATEKELVASLESVVALTPEAEIADQLRGVAEAKSDLVEVDLKLADELEAARADLAGAERSVADDGASFQQAIDAEPLDWDLVRAAAARTTAATEEAAARGAAAQALAKTVAEQAQLRQLAVDDVAGPAPSVVVAEPADGEHAAQPEAATEIGA